MERFDDRADAGRQLGLRLVARPHDDTDVVLGLPRGGVVVAYEVARVLAVPLDIVVVRKLGAASQPELAIGAIAEGDVRVRAASVCDRLHTSEEEYARAVSREQPELDRRVGRYRRGHCAVDLHGRGAIVVDDGVATGASARAAAESVRSRSALRVTIATPIASAQAVKELAGVFDEVVTLMTVRGPFSVGAFYARFDQTSDREVTGYLRRSQRIPPCGDGSAVRGGPWTRSATNWRSP